MSKFTINAALALLRFVLNLLPRAIRVVYAIIDLVDDGCINSSVPRPAWMTTLSSVIDTLTAVGSELTYMKERTQKDSG